MKVYFISGLGADSRVFKHIQLPVGYDAVYLDWMKPLSNESLVNYAHRMAKAIDTNKPFSLVGLSMGGMIVSEMAKQFSPVHTILISSAPAAKQLPVYFKWVAKMGLHKAVPVSLVKSSAIAKRFFTAETPEDKKLLKQVIRESDSNFIRWAMNAILHWENETLPTSYIHIHGTKDEVLPLRYTKPTHIIAKGGHMLVMTHAKEINQLLQEYLQP